MVEVGASIPDRPGDPPDPELARGLEPIQGARGHPQVRGCLVGGEELDHIPPLIG